MKIFEITCSTCGSLHGYATFTIWGHAGTKGKVYCYRCQKWMQTTTNEITLASFSKIYTHGIQSRIDMFLKKKKS